MCVGQIVYKVFPNISDHGPFPHPTSAFAKKTNNIITNRVWEMLG